MTTSPSLLMEVLRPYGALIAGLITALLVAYALNARASHTRATFPPGPKPLPVIGNLLDIPTSEEWITWRKYNERYGDLVYLTALGRNYLLLGSQEVISDLVEKRSHFNDRPHSTMLNELMGGGSFLPIMPYGEAWRSSRKLFHSQMHAKAAEEYRPHQLRGARRFVRDLLAAELDRPLDKTSDAAKAVLPHMVRYNFAYTALNMVYGIDVNGKEMEARFVEPIERAMHNFSEAVTPGRFVVDYIPWLKYVPSWVPGAGFQRFAADATTTAQESMDRPFDYLKAAMASQESALPVMAAKMLEHSPQDEDMVKRVAVAVYAAGSDTTVSAVTSYFLAALIYLEVQQRAQEELDRVVGRERFADFDDKAHLPYLEGVIRECLRWLPVVPVATPHMTSQEDHYCGYYIPKGTIVLPFQWGLLQDEATYPNPSAFSPERHLTRLSDGRWKLREDVPDPRAFAFGFGRRVCPGTHIAEQSLFAVLTTVLQTLDVVRAKDHDGREVIPEARVNSGLLCHPLPFAYELRARKDAQPLVELCSASVENR